MSLSVEALGAYRCHLNGGDGEANLTTFFTRRLHEIGIFYEVLDLSAKITKAFLESKAEQYKKSRGNKKRELKGWL